MGVVLAGTASAAASTLPVNGGLQLWLDASDNTTVFDENGLTPSQAGFTGIVSTWRDKSTTGATATSAGVDPASYSATGLNGMPTIGFSGGGAVAGNGSYFLIDFSTVTAAETILIVSRMADDGNNRGPWVGNGQSFSSHGVPGSLFIDANRYFLGTSNGLFGGVANPTPTDPAVFVETRSNNVAEIFEDGVQVGRGFAAPGTIGINSIGFFDFPPGGRTFFGDISEILIYDRALSDDELNDVGFYLGDKYDVDTSYEPPPAPIPLPSALPLFLAALAAIGGLAKRRGRAA